LRSVGFELNQTMLRDNENETGFGIGRSIGLTSWGSESLLVHQRRGRPMNTDLQKAKRNVGSKLSANLAYKPMNPPPLRGSLASLGAGYRQKEKTK
jgi:hypothetical protein